MNASEPPSLISTATGWRASYCLVRARGDAQPDSDYDVAVFLRDMPDRWAELDRLAKLRVDFIDATGTFIDAVPYPVTAYSERSPLMHEIRQEGVDL